MNWLAHVFLSEYNTDFQVGNFLADPLKAKPWNSASSNIKKGMLTHKIIDSYTDSHTLFKVSKSRLKDKALLRGIIVDFIYDYLLSKNWNRFCNIEINTFIEDFYKNAIIQTKFYPSNTNKIVENLVNRDLLNYQTFEHLEIAFKRIDKRVSPKLAKRDSAISYLEIAKKNINDIEKDFLEFFPELSNKVKDSVDKNKLIHWKL